jgi:hypothetical protein
LIGVCDGIVNFAAEDLVPRLGLTGADDEASDMRLSSTNGEVYAFGLVLADCVPAIVETFIHGKGESLKMVLTDLDPKPCQEEK